MPLALLSFEFKFYKWSAFYQGEKFKVSIECKLKITQRYKLLNYSNHKALEGKLGRKFFEGSAYYILIITDSYVLPTDLVGF